ncbi:rubrerythrin [Sedimentisphaera salicampi]|uniref:Rubrerythrin n=1 Tax=Sedimentisphaera salicampi TaxID=1941349 RepID=A0A1W6LM97_9BACT|nr:rubrerythrin family protein [Sedimentisphaera salicampi]ARN56899.1 Rubrerythrin [Sedimentisphaera salicampi]OXU15068.1 Rubrerythrin [Sedimentisphaera salicampi]
MELKGSKTEANLLKAFAGESQARNRYTYFAEKAREEGYEQIANIFEETANHEKEHAKRLFSFMEGREVEITAAYPAGKVGTTVENLQEGFEGENYEVTTMYPNFADEAEQEGFKDIARLFRNIAKAEMHHRQRYTDLKKNLEEGKVFSRDGNYIWMCINCGYLHEGKEAPSICPTCRYPKAYFQLKPENY